jgi:hypothetical protein
MSRIGTMLFAVALAATVNAHAAEKAAGNKTQANKMSQCSTDAKQKGLRGEARKEFMRDCLRSPATRAAAKACDASAVEQGLKDAQRKSFVKDCIKAKKSGRVGRARQAPAQTGT